MRTKKVKPLAYSFSCGGYDVVYRCGHCKTVLSVADYRSWKYCPVCGTPIDWGVVITANAEFRQLYLDVIDDFEKRDKVMAILDKLNATLPEDIPQQMNQTPKTRQQILRSNIRYYTSQGWTKERLIAEGFFTQEDFDIAEGEDL